MAVKTAVKNAAKMAAKKPARKAAKKVAKKPAKKPEQKTAAKRASGLGPRPAAKGPARRPTGHAGSAGPVARPARPPTRAPAGASAAYAPARLSIRMYRHGLGDCLLLRFAKSDSGTFNVLIDCGLISVASEPKEKMQAVVEDIADICDSRLDVVVMTHEHWDHASGFSTQQAQDLFKAITIREVWYAWTEDPANSLGRKLRKEREAKVKAVSMAAKALAGLTGNALAARRSDDLGSLLGFFGLDPAAAKSGSGNIGKTRAAFEYLGGRAGVRVRYRHPEDGPVTLRDVDNLRVYTLGPPEDEVLLKKSRPTKSGREVYELTAELGVTTSLERAFDRLASADAGTGSASDCPFDETYHARGPSPELIDLQASTWDAPGEEWRRIELDWTQAAENLAIDLDTHTNNSCLVLAFEFTDTGEVFLFPADAQVGNWLSWQDLSWKVRGEEGTEEVTAADLLARTVFYKVGHHGSHNATLRDLGLELMTNEDLTAFIPVIEAEAKKNRWNEMPFKPLVKRLTERTRGRLLRSDDASSPKDASLKQLTTQERNRFRGSLVDHELYYELSFK